MVLPNGFPTEIAWDTLIYISAQDSIQARDLGGHNKMGLSVWIIEDTILDYVTIHIKGLPLPRLYSRLRFQVFALPHHSSGIADGSPAFRADDPHPSPAPVLLAFWNTFPAYTPAQALRRWDGAHAGPYGSRHGLYNLLRAARNHRVPLVLLDLKYLTTLPALDYVNGLTLVQEMLFQDLLILPDVLPLFTQLDSPNDLEPLSPNLLKYLFRINTQTAHNFDLPSSLFVFTPLTPQLPSQYPVIFTPLPNSNQQDVPIFRWQHHRVVPVPIQASQSQASPDGPSLEVRRALIQLAITMNSNSDLSRSRFFLLGGDLPNSEWGVPAVARAAFRYINTHPWIRPLGGHDLLSAHSSMDFPEMEDLSSLQLPTASAFQTISNEILKNPDSRLSQAAMQTLLAAYAPYAPESPELSRLRANFIGQAHILLLADQWAGVPHQISTCNIDVDLDGKYECVLANTSALYVFEPEKGSLTFAFALSNTGVHQIIAPSSQFVFGTSDASSWNLEDGLRSDPQVLSGAFADNFGPYQASYGEDWLVMQGERIHKTFRLIPNGLLVKYQAQDPIQIQIPLAIDPWERFIRGWEERYSGHSIPNGWEWGISSGITVRIQTQAAIVHHTFKDTRAQMLSPENPNAEQTTGHYLPFPLSLITVSTQGNLSLTLIHSP